MKEDVPYLPLPALLMVHEVEEVMEWVMTEKDKDTFAPDIAIISASEKYELVLFAEQVLGLLKNLRTRFKGEFQT